MNPFRYRGYYYDTETGLYYLKTRYYDPEIGRFITIDDTSYLDPETINGLNLYAYCGNNPVMNVDANGAFFLTLFSVLASLVIGAVIGGIAGGITAVATGQDFWAGFAGGVVSGFISTLGVGLAIVTGGAGGLLIAGVAGFVAGFSGSIIQQGISVGWNNIDYKSAITSGAFSAIANILTFGFTNFAMRGTVGLFDDIFDKAIPYLTRVISALKISFEAIFATGMFSMPMTMVNSITEIVFSRIR